MYLGIFLGTFIFIFFLFVSLDWQRSREPPSQKVEALLYFHFTSLYLIKRNFTHNHSVPYRVADWHTVNIIKTLLPKIYN
jgi:hypothetical protein